VEQGQFDGRAPLFSCDIEKAILEKYGQFRRNSISRKYFGRNQAGINLAARFHR
jgi:hypothetical protein